MRKLTVLLALAIVGALSVSAVAAADEAPGPMESSGSALLLGPENCEEGYACTWTDPSFQGERHSVPCGSSMAGGWSFRSLKNRCLNRPVYYSYPRNSGLCVPAGQNLNGNTSNWWSVVDPGGHNTNC